MGGLFLPGRALVHVKRIHKPKIPLHHKERPNAYSTQNRENDCPRGVYYGEIDLARVI